MTMHLEGPWLSTTGRRRGKTKFRSAEEKRRAEELSEQWAALKARYEPKSPVKLGRKSFVPPQPLRRDANEPRYNSVDSGHRGAVSSKPSQQYTGTEVLGIAVMHKSCLQPVFSQEAARDSATMRRG
jgi:hypothetical protein